MNETLNFLTDYFNTTDNVFMQNKIEILKAQIDLEITKQQIEFFNTINNK